MQFRPPEDKEKVKNLCCFSITQSQLGHQPQPPAKVLILVDSLFSLSHSPTTSRGLVFVITTGGTSGRDPADNVKEVGHGVGTAAAANDDDEDDWGFMQEVNFRYRG